MVMFYLVLMDYSNPEPNAKPNITHFVEFVDVLKMFLLNFGPKLRSSQQNIGLITYFLHLKLKMVNQLRRRAFLVKNAYLKLKGAIP